MGLFWKKYFLKYSPERGFTLVELLTVITIIAVLAGGLVVAINPLSQIQRSRDAQRKSDLEQVQRGLEQYYNDTNAYPASVPFGAIWVQNGVTYIQKVPQDPENLGNGKKYVYQQQNNGQAYQLYASLDNASDPQLCFAGGGKCTNAPGNSACGGVCNYGVSSPNVSP